MDDRLGQTVTRLKITLCLMLCPRDLVFRPDNMDETVPHICSENKVADQLGCDCVADLCLCFGIFNQQVLS